MGIDGCTRRVGVFASGCCIIARTKQGRARWGRGPEAGSISDVSPHMRHPRWVIPLILCLSLVQPLLGLWLTLAPPENTAATGLLIPDSAIFFQSMEMFSSDYHSSYATCQSDGGDQNAQYFAVPHLWLYGFLGVFADAVGLSHFWAYLFANGLGVALYLSVTYLLLRAVAPKVATRAFLLFACSGGLGGALFLAARMFGWTDHPQFETYFFRFAAYDLMEGAHLNPVTYAGRLYYTLSLSGLTLGLLAVIKGLARERLRMLLLLAPILFLSSFLNARFGWFFVAVTAFYLIRSTAQSPAVRFNFFGWFTLPVSVGAVMSFQFMQKNPAVIANHLEFGNMAMWLSPFLVVAGVHLLLLCGPLLKAIRDAPGIAGYLLRFALFYLWAFGLLHAGYQIFYGTWLEGRDGTVAAAVSDFALALALFGSFLDAILRFGSSIVRGVLEDMPGPRRALLRFDWVMLWFMGFTSIAVSGFGDGWFLRLGPQRLEVLIWLPLCLLTALVLEQRSRAFRRLATTALVGLGLTSMAVSMAFFQGPLARADAKGAFGDYHAEVMHVNDAEVIRKIKSGTVMALPPASDVIVRQRGNEVVYGVGSFNLSGKYYGDAKDVAEEFFRADTPAPRRRAIVDDLCVRYVYLSETWPVDKKVRWEMSRIPWLLERARAGDAVLYQVMPELDANWDPYLASLSG